jgi:hypothetical protein
VITTTTTSTIQAEEFPVTATFTALADQVEAANRHQMRGVSKLSDPALTAPLRLLDDLPPGALPFAQELRARLSEGLLGLRLGFCPHLSPVAPQQAFWVPWAPSTVRCLDCWSRLGARLRGTNADRTCDKCGKYRRDLSHGMVSIAGMAFDLERPFALPPITITFGICGPCLEIEGS